ncbi:salicylate carboxymethyltransferase-like [Papaver somniferum]|uniref:salicylate carboxymethyltransferase-like n=1 Tax=Papaver somniferum TaxID=3469 RepID=UPI000E6FDB57|nr:salicylate carboxymethyltransferase-like [Papaver somniferum]
MSIPNYLHVFSFCLFENKQKKVILITRPIVEEAILNMLSNLYGNNTISAATSKPRKTTIGITELGCSSGPNALSVVSRTLEMIYNKHCESGIVMPEILVFLNDLPSNDFNTLFKDVGNFCDDLRRTKGDDSGPCFAAGMPGTFYGRLFPSDTLHFVHSSYSLHWLSQAPKEIKKTNKGNFYITKYL